MICKLTQAEMLVRCGEEILIQSGRRYPRGHAIRILPGLFTNRLSPDQHLVGNSFLIEVPVGLTLGEDMPD